MPRRASERLVVFTPEGPLRRSPNDHLWEGHDERPDPNRPVNHAAALETASWLTETFFTMNRPMAARIQPADLIEVLNRAKVRFVLVGAHGIAGWLHQPRSTRDVYVVVGMRDYKKAVRAIESAYPALVVDEQAAVTRFRDPDDQQVAIDVLRPYDLYATAFKNSVPVAKTHRVPNLELALAGKFAAMVSRHREREKRLLDLADFVGIVKQNYPRIHRDRLQTLGELVYAGGGAHLLECVDDAQANRDLRL